MLDFSTASSKMRTPFKQNRLLQAFLAIFTVCWVVTYINTTDYANWYIENILTFLFLTGLTLSYRKFVFSDLSYTLIFLYILLHIYGAEYTYSENPFGYWLKDALGLARNQYDRIVHCAFGLLLAYPLREYFQNWFQWPAWVCFILPIDIAMSFGGAYEVIEWLVADVFFKAQGAAYLGTQGDIWDAQKDMAIAVFGAMIAMGFTYAMTKLFKRK
jgi:putative membrane protein